MNTRKLLATATLLAALGCKEAPQPVDPSVVEFKTMTIASITPYKFSGSNRLERITVFDKDGACYGLRFGPYSDMITGQEGDEIFAFGNDTYQTLQKAMLAKKEIGISIAPGREDLLYGPGRTGPCAYAIRMTVIASKTR
jgi:hypothetical protein